MRTQPGVVIPPQEPPPPSGGAQEEEPKEPEKPGAEVAAHFNFKFSDEPEIQQPKTVQEHLADEAQEDPRRIFEKLKRGDRLTPEEAEILRQHPDFIRLKKNFPYKKPPK